MGLEDGDAAEVALTHDAADGCEIAGVAPILIDRNHASLLLGDLHQILRLGECRRERLVDDHMMSREQALSRNGMMRRIRRRDDDEIDLACQ